VNLIKLCASGIHRLLLFPQFATAFFFGTSSLFLAGLISSAAFRRSFFVFVSFFSFFPQQLI